MVRRAGSRFGVPFALPPRRSPGFTPFGCAISWVSHCCYFWCFCSRACWCLPACFCPGYHVSRGGAGEHSGRVSPLYHFTTLRKRPADSLLFHSCSHRV